MSVARGNSQSAAGERLEEELAALFEGLPKSALTASMPAGESAKSVLRGGASSEMRWGILPPSAPSEARDLVAQDVPRDAA